MCVNFALPSANCKQASSAHFAFNKFCSSQINVKILNMLDVINVLQVPLL